METRRDEDVADTEQQSSNNFTNSRSDIEIKKERSKTGSTDGGGGREDVADTKIIGTGKLRHSNQTQGREGSYSTQLNGSSSTQRTQGWWDIEPDVGRVAHGVSGRVHRLRALGNSIIPQIAEEIGRAIVKADSRDKSVSQLLQEGMELQRRLEND